MVMVDPLADALINIKNHELASKRECLVRPASKLLGEVLQVMQRLGYVSTYERIDDGREGIYRINLVGKINECRAVKPRYAVKKNEYEKYEKRYLPSKEIGALIISTPKGVVSHTDAKGNSTGGRLLAYIY